MSKTSMALQADEWVWHTSSCSQSFGLTVLVIRSFVWQPYEVASGLCACRGSFPHQVAKERRWKETPAEEERIQAAPRPAGRQNYPWDRLVSGTQEVESALTSHPWYHLGSDHPEGEAESEGRICEK
jgi:hypothetical protein